MILGIIDELIRHLASQPTSNDLFNPYASDTLNASLRRANLRQYLLDMQARGPAHLMVMEAPGYRGCRLTGIPVTSRRIVHDGVPALALFGPGRGYAQSDDAGFEDIAGEQSATIVWATLSEIGIAPLIWNAVPWHPHRPGQARTNRPPRPAEVQAGQESLRTVLSLFQPRSVAAIGRTAERSLAQLSVAATPIRHPAQGGKADFVAGLRTWLAGPTT